MKLDFILAIIFASVALYFCCNPLEVKVDTPDFQAYEKRNLLEGIDVKPKE